MSKIKNLPKEDCPREKALKYGLNYLTDAELLALIIGSGTYKKNVLEISYELLNKFQSLNLLIEGDIQDLSKICGISTVNALKVLASLTLGTRLYKEKISKLNLESYRSMDIYNYYSYLFKSYKNERIIALFINRLGVIYKEVLLASGSEKVIYLALNELTKYFDKNISKIVLLHNHLSMSSSPSSEDIEATITIENELKSKNIILLDHLIISKENYFSFYDNKLLKIR